MYHPSGLAVDVEGKLWVAESYEHPKCVSVWSMKDGSLDHRLLGPTQNHASGSAINPQDPNLMIGAGCEWRLDSLYRPLGLPGRLRRLLSQLRHLPQRLQWAAVSLHRGRPIRHWEREGLGAAGRGQVRPSRRAADEPSDPGFQWPQRTLGR